MQYQHPVANTGIVRELGTGIEYWGEWFLIVVGSALIVHEQIQTCTGCN